MAVPQARPSIGCDPELMAVDMRNRPAPVYGKIGGTKENPIVWDNGEVIPGPTKGPYRPYEVLTYQEDGAAIEFGISPAYSTEAFTHNVRAALAMCKMLLRRAGLKQKIVSEMEYDPSDLEHPLAKVIGCSTDTSAYRADGGLGEEHREPFEVGQFGNKRFAGGHIHIGYNKQIPAWVGARVADLYLGLPSIFFDKQGDRRKYYGKPGIFREKEYGLEYRTLSPLWLRSDSLINATAESAMFLASVLNGHAREVAHIWDRVPWAKVQQVILDEDEAQATMLMSEISRLPIPYGPPLTLAQLGRERTEAERRVKE